MLPSVPLKWFCRTKWPRYVLYCALINIQMPWWRHEMETFSALLALCEGNPTVTGGFPSQRPVTLSFDIFFDLSLNKQLMKYSRRRWFETCSLWRHCNGKQWICRSKGMLPLLYHQRQKVQWSFIYKEVPLQVSGIPLWWPDDLTPVLSK